MTQVKKSLPSVIFTLFVLFTWQSLAETPAIIDNPGLPGLLAEIATLEEQLALTENELATTESELTTTELELATTQASLVESRAEVLNTEALLNQNVLELEQEKKLYRVPQTGQDQCWSSITLEPTDPHFVAAECSTGQDGDKQAGLAPPSSFRFVDNEDGTITDTFTKLVWLKDAGCLNNLTWEVAVAQGAKLPQVSPLGDWLCNLDDGTKDQGLWRLPNVHELMSLLDFKSVSRSGQSLPQGHPFTAFEGFYWTSTSFALDPTMGVVGIHPCEREGYGHNRNRFNDAYIVSVYTGQLIHAPKAIPGEILTRHGEENGGGNCTSEGFTSGGPDDSPNGMPHPGFIAVRDYIED